MPADRRMLRLVTGFMRCTECHRVPELRPWLLTKDSKPEPKLRVRPRPWFPPRGWAGSLAAPPRPLVVLSTNPGHPLEREEHCWSGFPDKVADARRLSEAQALAQLEFVSALYRAGEGGTRFHTRSVKFVRVILWLMKRAGVPLAAGWFDNVWFSDVVKCSTAKETGSPGIDALATKCSGLLQEELRLLRPRLVIAFGDRAWAALMATQLVLSNAIHAPHPQKQGSRRITDAEHDDWLAPVCEALGLDWSVERPIAEPIRAALHRDAWCADPSRGPRLRSRRKR